MLFALAEYVHVNLKPLTPWLLATSWLLWGVALFAFVADRPWHSAFLSLYDGGGLVLSWLKRKYLFESSLTPPQSLSALLTVPKPTYVAARDVATASPWYVEKFGLRKLSSAEQLQPDGIALQFDASSNPVILLPKDPRFSAVLLYFSLAKSIKLGPD